MEDENKISVYEDEPWISDSFPIEIPLVPIDRDCVVSHGVRSVCFEASMPQQ